MPLVFISYSRKDGAGESQQLYAELEANGVGAWRDNRINPAVDFTGEIEDAIESATHFAVILTPDVKRADSFVRLEIGYALTQKKPIIPLVFPGGHRPITIFNHTYIDFSDWDSGMRQLLVRLKNPNQEEIDPQTRREQEIAYLQVIGQRYDHWRDLYTDMAATAQVEGHKIKLTRAAQRIIETRHAIYQQIDDMLTLERVSTIKTESFNELREALRQYRRVALIGDPGAGKTTTLERLAYEYATVASEELSESFQEPLPLFIRLGAYTGEDFTQFLESTFGGLKLRDYLPYRVLLLLDGLNEMPYVYHGKLADWLSENPKVAVIVSCRKLDYTELKLPLQRVEVAPLDLERIRLFIGNYLETESDRETLFWALAGYEAERAWQWYQREKPGTTYRQFFFGDDAPGYDYIPERKILDRVRHGLRETERLPDMLDVVTNPFLLQVVIEIYHLSDGEAPRNKGDLFGRFTALLFAERGKRAVRADRAWIPEDIQRRVLAVLAYRMQRDKLGTSVSVDFVRETIRETLRHTVIDVDPDLLLYLAVSAGILEQTDSIRFTHQLLQEYFAACEMREDLRRGVPATKYFPAAEWWLPTGWEETALLVAGMLGDATPVVEWLTPVQPNLAFRVARESGAQCADSALKPLYEPIQDVRRSPFAVAEWGRLNHAHDPRPGVGLGSEGLPDLVWCDVPPGRFIMGPDDLSDTPRREEEIPYAFKIAKYPITFIQFQVFLDSGEYDDLRWWAGMPEEYRAQPMAEQRFAYHNHPRDTVSGYQALAYTRWLNHHMQGMALDETGSRRWIVGADVEIRLPLETEWEYAARGTDGRQYPWGDDYRVGYANVDEQEQDVGYYFLNHTTAVGLYPQGASPFGVFDMSGTIWEWCLNDYKNPHLFDGFNDDSSKVLRGGSYVNDHVFALSPFRGFYGPDGRIGRHGLRVVASVPVATRLSRSSHW